MEFDVAKLTFLGGVALILAFVQLSKIWIQDGRYYPLVALFFGLAINIAISLKLGLDIFNAVFMGLIAGFTAMGMYSADVTKPPEG